MAKVRQACVNEHATIIKTFSYFGTLIVRKMDMRYAQIDVSKHRFKDWLRNEIKG